MASDQPGAEAKAFDSGRGGDGSCTEGQVCTDFPGSDGTAGFVCDLRSSTQLEEDEACTFAWNCTDDLLCVTGSCQPVCALDEGCAQGGCQPIPFSETDVWQPDVQTSFANVGFCD